jgi:hypothetical protein
MCIIHQGRKTQVGWAAIIGKHEGEPEQTTLFPMCPPAMYLIMMK